MRALLGYLAALTLVCAPQAMAATAVGYTAADNISIVPVSQALPLPTICLSGCASTGAVTLAATIGSPVPTWADPLGFNSGGNLVGVSAANNLPVADSALLAAAQSSVGTSGGTTPTGIGFNGGAASSTVPTPVTTGTTVANWLDLSGRQHVTGDSGMSPLLVSQSGSGTACQTTALAANLVCNAAASTLLDFTVTADSTLDASAWYVMFYNATSAPADGAVTPVKCYQVPAGVATYGATFTLSGVTFSTGLTMGVSTTGCFTKTASTHALFMGATYR